mgnify:CR=1 FL=1|tara:strand:+ start:4286 stop:5014 length:729 start_codon:yes stop_codon:yes gene_type:complete
MTSPTSIVIPILNEGKNINKMIKLIRYSLNKMKYEIVFIDDDSNDNTKFILEKNKKKFKNIQFFIRKKYQKDLSQSCILGFKKSKYKNILVMDGDLQHNPKYLPKMIKIFNKKNLDFLIASRNFSSAKKEGLSFLRFYASKVIISIFLLVIGNKTADPMSGFFIFKKKIFLKNKNMLFGKGYKILSDLIYSGEKDLKIHDFNIKFETRKKGKSKMGLGVLFQLIKFISITGLKKLNLINFSR